jgi:hypothetical protein
MIPGGSGAAFYQPATPAYVDPGAVIYTPAAPINIDNSTVIIDNSAASGF